MIADTYLSVATPVQVALPRCSSRGIGAPADPRSRTIEPGCTSRAASPAARSTCARRMAAGAWCSGCPCVGVPGRFPALALLDRDVIVHPGILLRFAARRLRRDQPACQSEADLREGLDGALLVAALSSSRNPHVPRLRSVVAPASCSRSSPRVRHAVGASATSPTFSASRGPWLRASGLRMLQVLPVNDMATGPDLAVLGPQRHGHRTALHRLSTM